MSKAMKLTHSLRFLTSLLIVIAVVASAAVAQKPAAGDDTTTSTTGTAAAEPGRNVQQTLEEILEEPASADTYRYDPQGRRDPFQSLVGPTPLLKGGERPPGVPGFLIDEMKLQGVVSTKGGLVAMVAGPDSKGYLLHAGEKVFDGEVLRITPSSVVFRQAVNDPTQIERFREVVKDLNPSSASSKQ
jgi:Tfp pilus assembly protein PilP